MEMAAAIGLLFLNPLNLASSISLSLTASFTNSLLNRKFIHSVDIEN